MELELLIVDTTGIQSYIFGSNRLRENSGASYLVAEATRAWAFDTLQELKHKNNVKADHSLDATKRIEDPSQGLAAEVIYAGGGNFVVIFRDRTLAEQFTRALSLKALREAPGLQLIIAHQSFDWSKNDLDKATKAVFEQLAKAKRARIPSVPVLGLGVTMRCQSTGLPAVGGTPSIRGKSYPASGEILAKCTAATKQGFAPSEADTRLREMLPLSPTPSYAYPSEFDELGASRGEHGYYAAVHIDGNDMGKSFQDVGQGFENRPHIEAKRRLSQAVEEVARRAMKEVLCRLLERIQANAIAHPKLPDLAVPLAQENGTVYLPFRPLVFGGDDVTFVCDGRLGMALAVEYLRQFEAESERHPHIEGKLTACAGIAIVKSHYPFARAYALAEDLCRSAKRYRSKQNKRGLNLGSCLDWHFAQSGLSGDIKIIRGREYKAKNGKDLILRPVALEGITDRAWEVVRRGIEAFQGEAWRDRRNKVKGLQEALREGGEAVRWFLQKYGGTLPEEVEPSNNPHSKWPTEGWHGDDCGYFDAIEVLETLTSIRHQTAINEWGAPEKGSLRALRVVLRETLLVAELTFVEPPDGGVKALLAGCVLCLRRAGTGRNRGRGRLCARLYENGVDCTDAYFHPLKQHLQGQPS